MMTEMHSAEFNTDVPEDMSVIRNLHRSAAWRMWIGDLYAIAVILLLAIVLLFRVWHVNVDLGMSPSLAKLVRNALMCGAFAPFVLLLRLSPLRYRGSLWIIYCVAVLLVLGWAMRLDIEYKYNSVQTTASSSGESIWPAWKDLSAPLVETIFGFLAALAGFLLMKRFHNRIRRWHILLYPALAVILLASGYQFDLLHRGVKFQIWLGMLPVTLLAVGIFLTNYIHRPEDIKQRPQLRRGYLIPFAFTVVLPMMTFLAFEELGVYLILLPLVVSMFYMATRQMRFVVYGVVIAACLCYGLLRFYSWSGSQELEVVAGADHPAVAKAISRVHGRLALFLDFWEGFPASESPTDSVRTTRDLGVRKWMTIRGQEVLGHQAVARGGYWGLGVATGNPQILPYATNDQMYSHVAEQLGLAGNLLVLLCFVVIAAHCFLIGSLAGQNVFISLIPRAIGLFFLLLWGVGVAGQLNVFLQTGIGIPFICKSGSLSAICLFVAGVALGCEASTTRRESVVGRFVT